MTTSHPHVGGVDFVTVFVSDFAAATGFYGTTLGLRCSSRYERIRRAEFETGNLTLQVLTIDPQPRALLRPSVTDV